MEREPLTTREELTGIFFVITDINANIERILRLLEEHLGEISEEDS